MKRCHHDTNNNIYIHNYSLFASPNSQKKVINYFCIQYRCLMVAVVTTAASLQIIPPPPLSRPPVVQDPKDPMKLAVTLVT
jgi:hypothetical protein